MILKSSNWQPSITRSIKGNSSYTFLNHLFDSDVGKLKVEILIVNPSIQVQILPCNLIVIYQESIDDDIFPVTVGDKKALATLIEGIQPYPFKLRLDNPNKSQLTCKVSKPVVERKRANNVSPSTSFAPPVTTNSYPSYHHHHSNMSIGYPEQSSSGQQNAVDNITTVIPPSTATATAFVMLAANTNRAAGGRIDNATNRDFYVSFNSTQTPTPGQPFNLLPRSGNVGGTLQPGFLDIPNGYLGAIYGIAVSGNSPISGNIYVHEMVIQ